MSMKENVMDLISLRYTMAMDRIREIPGENAADPLFVPYFEEGARLLSMLQEHAEFLAANSAEECDEASLLARNRELYEEVLPGNYERSFANPSYAVKVLGDEFGALLSALRYEIRSAIPFVYRAERERFLIRAELFLEVYTAFTVAFAEKNGGRPAAEQIRSIIRQYLADYAQEEMLYHVSDRLIEGNRRIYDMVMSDSFGVRQMCLTGEYVTNDEIVCMEEIGRLSEDRINEIAEAITEGYRRGFINNGKNLSAKKTTAFIFHLGFERIVRACVPRFEKMGLKVILSAEVPSLFHEYRRGEAGYCGADPNPQYYYDHREDPALFLDEALRTRRIEGLSNAYRALRNKTLLYAGPAVIETFGRVPFHPSVKKEAPSYNTAQKALRTEYEIKADALYADAVAARNRSYTIIAFPMPSISDDRSEYSRILDAVIEINTMDNSMYESVQGRMIDVLCRAGFVEVKGMNGNRTSLRIRLAEPEDPESEANFENCTADLNIPAGEVFTTPVLEGTQGILHVKGAFLDGLYYRDLAIEFTDGRVSGYSCRNFENDESCRRYIEENILFHHKALPMGECAIGTNTTAYAAAYRFGILDRLPILIAEKTGPHFAVGDTCYARDEENRVYNPDGREIIAKENSVTACRKKDPEKAYFGCHMDITIPYEELGEFTAVKKDGTRIPILSKGRFVLEGTQILNKPLDDMGI